MRSVVVSRHLLRQRHVRPLVAPLGGGGGVQSLTWHPRGLATSDDKDDSVLSKVRSRVGSFTGNVQKNMQKGIESRRKKATEENERRMILNMAKMESFRGVAGFAAIVKEELENLNQGPKGYLARLPLMRDQGLRELEQLNEVFESMTVSCSGASMTNFL